MNNQCINFRQRTKTKDKRKTVYFYCAKQRKEITFEDCKGCPYKEYKTQYNMKKSDLEWKNAQKSPVYCAKSNNNQINKTLQNKCKKLQSSAKLKTKSNKLAKLERERFSLFTDDLEHCIICHKSPVNKHEIFGGSANRKKSMEYGLVIPLCTCEHHDQVNCRGIHFDKKLRDEWHIKGQAMFTKTYPNLNFKDIFGKNYIK